MTISAACDRRFPGMTRNPLPNFRSFRFTIQPRSGVAEHPQFCAVRTEVRIAVVCARSLEAFLCIVPALRALSVAYPGVRITWVGLPDHAELARRFGRYVHEFAAFPGFPGVPGMACDLGALPFFFERMHNARFDLALQLHDAGGFFNPLTVLMGAQRTAGFYRPGAYCPDPERFIDWRDGEDGVPRCLRLLARLGVPARGEHLEFPLAAEDWKEWRALGLERYACLHLGGHDAGTAWPPAQLAAIGDALAMEGYQLVLTGTAKDAALAASVQEWMREPAVDLAGRASLGGFAALVGRAQLLVAADPGVRRLAAALRTPGIAISARASVPEVLAEARRHALRRAEGERIVRQVGERRRPAAA
jgi:ADP-heptose:LPS heptosyltransferase